ncbi:hypothetical protein [Candidatus Methanodesulfokora washburnensis]|uniref:Uncharacterized protein n=1 Tax=Candidatus Methanodesulfokora washburnensis TaxID=2478471 RepID=A0A429GFT9_9CREN|nr:hypothetical protein [Candidatus Methanodesulfokores washburnensis]RSN72643.1 hypothetical protein D6D85_12995 [Candidatus Methanodesulfokores washburnensis]
MKVSTEKYMEVVRRLGRAKEGVFIKTWDNFVVFEFQEHYVIMDEDRNRVCCIAHSKVEALNFLMKGGI